MCHGGELIGELLAPDSTSGRIWKIIYYAALVAVFFGGLYYAIASGAFR